MRRQIINALYELASPAEYPAEVLTEIQEAVDYFCKATGKDPAQIDTKIMNPITAAEAWAFEQGFMTCINLLSGKLFEEQEDRTNEKNGNGYDI